MNWVDLQLFYKVRRAVNLCLYSVLIICMESDINATETKKEKIRLFDSYTRGS